MSEDSDKESKTEEPTEKKIRDAVDKGQLPFAKEVPIMGSFLAILVFMVFFAQQNAFELASFLSTFLERPDDWSLSTEHDAVMLYRAVFVEIAKVLATLMALLVFAGLTASILQNVPRFVLDRVQPKISRVSLKQGWGRLFGAKGFVEFGKSVGKLVLAAAVLVFVMREAQNQLLAGMVTQTEAFLDVILQLTIRIVIAITLIMVVIGVVDILWSRFSWRQDLRMTRQEVKDEMKQTDGDPIMKARMRSLARDRARQRMISAVPKATLVIANPTHYAIALRYVRDESAAPVVIAKGQDLVALRIREVAEQNGIPVFEEVALARSMYSQVSVDKLIPPEFYEAVAELVRVVYAKQPQKGANRVTP